VGLIGCRSGLTALGFLVVHWALPALAKWAIIALSSLTISLGLYWVVIRPLNPLRFLFGMKPRPDRRTP
jgi:hypothetical protein